MKLNKYFYMGLGAITTLAIGVGAFAFTSSTQAAAAADDIVALTVDGEGDVFHPGRGGRGGFDRRGASNEFLLAELGITEAEFDAAKEAARDAGIDAAVEAGAITEEQADALRNGERLGRNANIDRDALDINKDELMANALGITVEAWETAKENAKAAAQEQALADGLITQEQIDMREAAQALRNYVDQDEVIATVLGVSVAEVEEAKENRTMAELVADSGMTRAEISTAIAEVTAELIDQAVEDGVITAEQAELLGEGPLSRGGFGSPRGNRGGGNRGGGFGPGTQGQGNGNGNGNGNGALNFGGNDA